ncbi:MAG: 6-hydroxymethylpterin diphosphokinase MptE-like protein [Phycisphaerales bacterium]
MAETRSETPDQASSSSIRPDPAILARNLAVLARTSPGAVRAIAAAPPAGDLRAIRTPSGAIGFVQGDPSRDPARERALCSRRDPVAEARRFADRLDPRDAAAAVVLGFGAGYHIAQIARRYAGTGGAVVFEPDVPLLRFVLERVDLAGDLASAHVAIVTDAADSVSITNAFHGIEPLVAMGLRIMPHAPSVPRLGERATRFGEELTRVVRAIKTNLMTTLVQSETTLRNVLQNLGYYASGGGIAPLAGVAEGRPAIVVSAGPSLRRNLDVLADPRVRERVVVIAVQTVLKTMLARGIRPDFVTALDHHEISRRFYEGLTPSDVNGVTLVVEPKANPAILDAFPGRIICSEDELAEGVLGDMARHHGAIAPGATVAHLAYHLARHMGCDPVVLIGQDLGFTDGQYYAPGAAIHQVWSGELSAFRTLEMFEWERIVRSRHRLHRAADPEGRAIYTDEQMLTYLVQFERHFEADASRGRTTIDATEGGVAKKHTIARSLRDTLAPILASAPPSAWRAAWAAREAETAAKPVSNQAVLERVRRVRQDAWRIAARSREAASLLEKILTVQHDQRRVGALIDKIKDVEMEVTGLQPAYRLTQFINQTGVLNRFRADRTIELDNQALGALGVQAAQTRRDIQNVTWIADAAEHLAGMLDAAAIALAGGPKQTSDVGAAGAVGQASGAGSAKGPRQFTAKSMEVARAIDQSAPSVGSPSLADTSPARGGGAHAGAPGVRASDSTSAQASQGPLAIAAVIPVDPDTSGLGTPRSLDATLFPGENLLRSTLRRLATAESISTIFLLTEQPDRVRELAGPPPAGARVQIIPIDAGTLAARRRAVGPARAWAYSSWRGGLAGLSCYDEAFDPILFARVMQERSLDAAVVCGPDWALIDPALVDQAVARHVESPEQRAITFCQAPPGLGAACVSRALVNDLARQADRAGPFASIGGILSYFPSNPRSDPIAAPACVTVPPHVRDLPIRCVPDSEPRRRLLIGALDELDARGASASAIEIGHAINAREASILHSVPQLVTIELCTGRLSSGRRREWSQGGHDACERPVLDRRLARRIFDQLADARADVALTLAGAGDPMLHPHWLDIAREAREAGIAAIHLRTDLTAPDAQIDRLIGDAASESGVIDAISVDLMGSTREAYAAIMGADAFDRVTASVQRLLASRRPRAATGGIPTPWVIPRLTRCDAVLDQIEAFYDHWLAQCGHCVIDPLPRAMPGERLEPLPLPASAAWRRARSGLSILADGSVPYDLDDLVGASIAGSCATEPVREIWRRIHRARLDARDEAIEAKARKDRKAAATATQDFATSQP